MGQTKRVLTAADGVWTHVDLDGTITTNAPVDRGDHIEIHGVAGATGRLCICGETFQDEEALMDHILPRRVTITPANPGRG